MTGELIQSLFSGFSVGLLFVFLGLIMGRANREGR